MAVFTGRWLTRAAAALLLAAGMFAPASGAEDGPGAAAFERSLAGQLLVAPPDMRDPRFAESVIYLVRHDAEGAMGLVINKAIGKRPLAEVLKEFGVESEAAEGNVRLHYGGPVQPELVFVLHTADYEGPGTTVLDDDLAITSRSAILEDIAKSEGPRRSLLAMGYAGWAPGQLDREMERRNWVVAPAEKNLIFSDDPEAVWERAREKAGLPL